MRFRIPAGSWCLVLTVLLGAGNDSRAQAVKPAVAPESMQPIEPVVEKVVYSEVAGKKLELDLAKPAAKGPFPALVFIHGGGWKGGSRYSYRGEIERAAKYGYTAVTITYRLTNPNASGKAESPFPAQIHDVKQAIRWLRAHADEHKVNPSRIGLVGASAGGHLSLLAGLSDKDSGLEGPDASASSDTRIQAVVNYFGPTDFPNFENIPLVQPLFRELLGGTLEQVPDAYRLVSPVTHASPDDPPVLTLHGDKDEIVPVSQAELLDKKMKEVGGRHELVVLTGQGHGFGGENAVRARKLQYEFFDKHLKATAPDSPAPNSAGGN
jgi:acetyl esterase/lipase